MRWRPHRADSQQRSATATRLLGAARLRAIVCTLVLAWRTLADAPVVVAANRDESVDRPSTPPELYRTEPRAVAPRDDRAGGTWIGYNEAGLFVGITNRWVGRDGDRSRGQLVADCLGCESADAAVDTVRKAVDTDAYAGFNLVVADADRATLLEWDGELTSSELDPGVHVVVNVGVDGASFEPPARPEVGRQQAANATAVREALAVGTTNPPTAAAWRERAATVLGDHEYGVCIHGDGFGTRSASLIEIERQSAESVGNYWFANGPPCRSRFKRVESRL